MTVKGNRDGGRLYEETGPSGEILGRDVKGER